MKPITLYLHAQRFTQQDRQAILLSEEAPRWPLRLALVVRGSEQHIFPALALDDWGREKKGPGLYRWLYEEGPRYPRAEVFGFDTQGDETQIFLRDLELSFRLPCYVFAQESDPIASGVLLHTIFVPGATGASEPQKVEPPDDLPFPVRRAALRWRQVNPATLDALAWRHFDAS